MGPWKSFSGACGEGLVRGKTPVEGFERGEESRHAGVPREGRGSVPDVFAVGQRDRPIEEIAHVSENLAGRAGAFGGAERCEFGGRAAHGLSAAIGERGHGVPQEICVCHDALPKSMKPRCGSAFSNETRTRSPTSRPCSPRMTRPSTGGSRCARRRLFRWRR